SDEEGRATEGAGGTRLHYPRGRAPGDYSGALKRGAGTAVRPSIGDHGPAVWTGAGTGEPDQQEPLVSGSGGGYLPRDRAHGSSPGAEPGAGERERAVQLGVHADAGAASRPSRAALLPALGGGASRDSPSLHAEPLDFGRPDAGKRRDADRAGDPY